MFTDIYTIIRKEWKELFLQRGSWKSGLINQLVVLGVLGIFLPLQTGPRWLTNPAMAITWLWLPVSLTMNMVAEAFAGERERHTLDTLLASRLSDQAILAGKMLAAVLYGFSIAVLSLVVAAVAINIGYRGATIQFYPLPIFLVSLLVVFMVNLLMSALGVLVSLRAPTARQAYQQLSVGLLILFIGPLLAFQLVPAAVKESLVAAISSWNPAQLMAGVILLLAVLNAGLIAAARARFQRAKLMDV
jgi:ABC-2 type transport system permease protein